MGKGRRIEAVQNGGQDGLIGGDGRESVGVDGRVGNGIGKSIEALRASCKGYGQDLAAHTRHR